MSSGWPKIFLHAFFLVSGFIIGGILVSFRPFDQLPKSANKTTRSVEADHSQLLLDHLKAENLKHNVRYFAKKPHLAGSPRNNDLADYIARKWRAYGFDKVEKTKYDILVSVPRQDVTSKVQILDKDGNVEFESQTKEKTVDESEDSQDVLPPFLQFSPSGEVEAEAVYANFGTIEDFALLEAMHVSLKGKIVIVRLGRLFRGNKIFNAASRGAIGVITYNDPEQFAPEGPGRVYPETVWLPDTGIQRGTAMAETGPGEFLTPGFPAVEGIYREPISEINLPSIPAFPMSYGDAFQILRRMDGQSVPDSWRGDLNLTYRTGPGFQDTNLRLRLEVHNRNETRTIYNVIGTITGSQEPDRYVLMGNHRDAWVYGAADAVSGTSILMELSRGLGELLKCGWKPRRTIKLCSWDAEEFFVVGSTEWVEENAIVLWDRAVAYLNMDVAVSGDFALNVDSSPVLCDFLLAKTKEIPAPNIGKHGRSIYDVMIERDVNKNVNKTATCNNLAFGSDYGAFYHFTGVSSADWSYIFGGKYGIRRSYPMYHSIHDTYNWMEKFIDPGFKIHLAVARYAASVLFKLSDSDLLPFNTTRYASVIIRYFHSLVSDSRFDKRKINFEPLSKAVETFEKTCEEFETLKNAQSKKADSQQSLRILNDQMTKLERAFIQTVEENKPRQLRHVIFGPNLKNLYDGMSFPRVYRALQEALRSHNWEEVKKEISLLVFHISSAAKQLSPVMSSSKASGEQCKIVRGKGQDVNTI